jgi:hypothetical protein
MTEVTQVLDRRLLHADSAAAHPDRRSRNRHLDGSSGPAASGQVERFGCAISPPDVALVEGVAGLAPQIEPTFDWVRLAQRVPVR